MLSTLALSLSQGRPSAVRQAHHERTIQRLEITKRPGAAARRTRRWWPWQRRVADQRNSTQLMPASKAVRIAAPPAMNSGEDHNVGLGLIHRLRVPDVAAMWFSSLLASARSSAGGRRVPAYRDRNAGGWLPAGPRSRPEPGPEVGGRTTGLVRPCHQPPPWKTNGRAGWKSSRAAGRRSPGERAGGRAVPSKPGYIAGGRPLDATPEGGSAGRHPVDRGRDP